MMYTNSDNKLSIYKNINRITQLSKMDKASPESILDLISLHEYHKFVLVKFYIKVGYPLTSQANINAIIGPYGVNIMNLQKKLEPLNEVFEKDTMIPIMLKVYDFDKYHIILKTPTLRFFLDLIEGDSNFISIYQVYELAKKKKRDLNLINVSESSLYFTIIGYLKSGNKSIYS